MESLVVKMQMMPVQSEVVLVLVALEEAGLRGRMANLLAEVVGLEPVEVGVDLEQAAVVRMVLVPEEVALVPVDLVVDLEVFPPMMMMMVTIVVALADPEEALVARDLATSLVAQGVTNVEKKATLLGNAHLEAHLVANLGAVNVERMDILPESVPTTNLQTHAGNVGKLVILQETAQVKEMSREQVIQFRESKP